MIIPLGTTSLRKRFPWATVTLIVINAIVFFLTYGPAEIQSVGLMAAERQRLDVELAIEREFLFPNGHPRPAQLAAMQGRKTPRQRDFWERFAAGQIVDPADEVYVRWARARDLSDERKEAHVYWRLGFRKSQANPVTLITSLFVHGGLFHVLFNMLYLWTVGVNMEDVWGRGLFLLFYFLGGVAATGAHALALPATDDTPLIGASGAVASVMGAFLVRHFRTKIRFYSLLIYVGLVRVKAGIILPIWVLLELRSALTTDAAGAGVAFWAHVGGFFVGALVALAFRAGQVEETLAPQLEEQDRLRRKREFLARAAHHQRRGEGRLMLEALTAAVAEDPGDLDARRQRRQLLGSLGDEAGALSEGLAILRLLWSRGERAAFVALFRELDAGVPDGLPAPLTLRAAQALGPDAPSEAAGLTYRLAQQELEPPLRTRVLTLHADLLDRLGAPDDAAATRRLLEAPDASAD